MTVLCSARHNLNPAWCSYRADGKLLQAALEDRVGVSVRWYEGDFSREPAAKPWRTVWPMDAAMTGLEAFLRAQLVLKNSEEELFIVVKDDDGRRSFFYSCLTPRELKLTSSSYIYCLGLRPTNHHYEQLSWAGWIAEARARFGEEAAGRLKREARKGEVEVRVGWTPLVASRLPGYQQGELLLTCPPAAPLLQVEAFLRSQLWPVQPHHFLHLTLTTSSSTSTDFYGLQTAEELGTKALLVQVAARPAGPAEWAAYRAGGLARFGAGFPSYWRWAVLGQPSRVLGKAERVGEEASVRLVIVTGGQGIQSSLSLWGVAVSPPWHTVR